MTEFLPGLPMGWDQEEMMTMRRMQCEIDGHGVEHMSFYGEPVWCSRCGTMVEIPDPCSPMDKTTLS